MSRRRATKKKGARRWVQKALGVRRRRSRHHLRVLAKHPGALHRDMQIPVGHKITRVEKLQWQRHLKRELLHARGSRRKLLVTKLRRVGLALTMSRFKHKRAR